MTAQMDQERNRTRIASAVGVAFTHLLLAYALITGLGLEIPGHAASERLRVFEVAEELPPPPVEQAAKAETEAPKEAAAPPNLEARPTPVVAPPPQVRLEMPPAVTTVTPGTGSAASAGASSQTGPGSGAGGAGTGTGGGGAGGDGAPATRARLIRGRIGDSDYPRAALRAGIEGTVTVRIAVGPNGRVSRCTIARSSGSADLDATTCRLIEQRFRYEPARDASGRNVADIAGGVQRWWIGER